MVITRSNDVIPGARINALIEEHAVRGRDRGRGRGTARAIGGGV